MVNILLEVQEISGVKIVVPLLVSIARKYLLCEECKLQKTPSIAVKNVL